MSLPAPVEVGADDLAAREIGGDLHRTMTRYLDYVVREWRTALADVERRQQAYRPPGERDDLASLREFTRGAIDSFARIGERGAGRLDHLGVDDLTWHEVTAEFTRDQAAGLAMWERIKRVARDERASAWTAAAAVEGYHARPWQRAQYFAVLTALADGLQPRNGMERLLIEGMAQAWTMRERWLHRAVETDSLDATRIERDARQRQEWQPPRLSDAAAVDRAAQMADRCERQFLRLMRAYRDQRRLLGAVVVAAGGQLNVAEQQTNITEGRASGDGEADG